MTIRWIGLKMTVGSGATAGRCCNRIRNSEVAINDVQYKLNANTPPHQLHGGLRDLIKEIGEGSHLRKIKPSGFNSSTYPGILEEDSPGNLSVEAIFTLNNKNEITIQYKANTDQTTICNITYPYYNLDQSENILNHQLFINADRITPVDGISSIRKLYGRGWERFRFQKKF